MGFPKKILYDIFTNVALIQHDRILLNQLFIKLENKNKNNEFDNFILEYKKIYDNMELEIKNLGYYITYLNKLNSCNNIINDNYNSILNNANKHLLISSDNFMINKDMSKEDLCDYINFLSDIDYWKDYFINNELND